MTKFIPIELLICLITLLQVKIANSSEYIYEITKHAPQNVIERGSIITEYSDYLFSVVVILSLKELVMQAPH